MRRTLTAALITVTVLGACGSMRDSRLNPFNWFKKSEESLMMGTVAETPSDPRSLVADVVDLTVEPYPGGAIIRARGATPATIAVLDGQIRIGLSDTQLELLGRHPDVMKLSRRDRTSLPLADSAISPLHSRIASSPKASARQPFKASTSRCPAAIASRSEAAAIRRGATPSDSDLAFSSTRNRSASAAFTCNWY